MTGDGDGDVIDSGNSRLGGVPDCSLMCLIVVKVGLM
jgi:hypothetical protein